MAKRKLTAEHKQQLEAMGLDVNALDWGKLFSTFKTVIALLDKFFNMPQSKEAKEGVAHHDGANHKECCTNVILAQVEALEVAMDHYHQCCEEEESNGE